MYRVGLDLTKAEVLEMKQLALDSGDISVQGLVTALVKDAITKHKYEKQQAKN